MKKLLLILITLVSFSTQAQNVTFCYNVEREVLEVEGVIYTTQSNLLDPNDTGDNYPYIRSITTNTLTSTVTGTIIVQIDAVDDNEGLEYEFVTDRFDGNRRIDGQSTGWISDNITTFRYRSPGIYNIYLYVRDSRGQISSANGPNVTIN